jgi:hypothetical protein
MMQQIGVRAANAPRDGLKGNGLWTRFKQQVTRGLKRRRAARLRA